MIIRQLTVQYHPHPSGVTQGNQTLHTPKAAAAVCVPILEHQAQEVFICLLLNARGRLMSVYEAGRGGLASVQVDPRVILRACLLTDAAAIVVAHNHPSGDPTPSGPDIILTRRLKECCDLFDVQLFDHVIVGDGRYVSLKEYGIL